MTEQRWIPVTEALPDKGQWYAGLTVQVERDFVANSTKARIYLFRTGYPREHFPLPDNLTHWCPLPSPQFLGGEPSAHGLTKEEADNLLFPTAAQVAPDLCASLVGYPIFAKLLEVLEENS